MTKRKAKKLNPVNRKKALSSSSYYCEELQEPSLPVADNQKTKRNLLRILLPVSIFVWLIYALVTVSMDNSVTVDELAHLPAGLVYWQTGDFSVYHHNPPLLRLMAAAPLLVTGIKVPEGDYDGNRWVLGYLFQKSLGEKFHAIYFPSRMVIASLTLFLALLLFYVTCRKLGWQAGIIALTLFSFNPLVLAHGALVTTDAGFALTFFATCVVGVYFFKYPTWKTGLLAGALLGIALLTKFTALLLLPILLFAAILLPYLANIFNETDSYNWLKLSAGRRCILLIILFITSIIVLDTGYLFKGVGQSLSSYHMHHPILKTIFSSLIGKIPSPLPADYIMGFDDQYVESSGIFSVYLLGQLTNKGWWYYYPIALIFKLPLMFYIILCILLVAIVMRKISMSLLLMGSLTIPLFVLVMFIIFTNINIGVRYLLFIISFLCIAIAHLAKIQSKQGRLKALISTCLVLYAGSVIVYHSNYIAYFSEICGGGKRGHHFLADSNLDWGQDLVRLNRYMQEKKISTVALSHFGPVDPLVYGINYVPVYYPDGPETVVISINHLLGIDPGKDIIGVDQYRRQKPLDVVGYSLWVFNRIEK